MIHRILLTVNDSGPALAAARVAVDLAQALGALLRVVTVAEKGHDPERVLRHVRDLAIRADIPVTTVALGDGDAPFEIALNAAVVWPADLIVMGRSGRRPTGRPYVGTQTEHLLEFAEVPVLVVPGPDGAGGRATRASGRIVPPART